MMRSKQTLNRTAMTLAVLGSLVFLNLIGLKLFRRVDLTNDRQYSLSSATISTLEALGDPLTIRAYFTSDLPPPYSAHSRYVRNAGIPDGGGHRGRPAAPHFRGHLCGVSPERAERGRAPPAYRGADKKRIADSIYRMLPDRVGEYELTLVKHTIPQERFEQLVQDGFDRFDRFFVQHQAHFGELFEQWKGENLPAKG